MTAPFTAPAAGVDWQALSFVNEIVRAYSERRQVLGQSAVPDLAAGADIQEAALWAGIQTWLEANCTGWVDESRAIDGQAWTGTAYSRRVACTYGTVDAWRTAAGLNAAGFRRATAWSPPSSPAWEYGTMQAGDIIGPWIFEDLQAGLSALAALPYYTGTFASSAVGVEIKYKYLGTFETTVDAALAASLSAYNSASWTPYTWSGTGFFTVSQSLNDVDPNPPLPRRYYASDLRVRGGCRITGAPTVVPSSARVFALLDRYTAVVFETNPFFPFDDAAQEYGKAWHWCDLGESSAAERTSATYPYTAAPQTLNTPSLRTAFSCACYDALFVLRFSFTNSNA